MSENLKLERQVFNLRTLYEIANTLATCRDSTQIYRAVLSILMGTFGVEYGFSVRREGHGVWTMTAERGLGEPFFSKFENAVLTQTFDTKRAEDKKAVIQSFLMKEEKGPIADNFCIWTEFAGRDKILAGVFLGKKLSGERYSESDLELIEAAGSQVAAALENLILYENLQAAQERLQLENIALRQEVVKEYEGGRIVGQSDAIRKVLQQARNVAQSPTNVLIYGETGTGKELLAKTIHYLSPRRDKPFVAVNCTAIPENLVESELFGIDAGVATGVRKHIGFFEQADGGTIFIDEIGDMPLTSQAKILRALQERCFRRVGATQEVCVDIRVVCATNKNLEQEMKAGNFREDLYFRLSVLELQLPGLRERRDDIPLLVNCFIKELQDKLGTRIKGFSKHAMRLLLEYDWPGNVRELENEVERAITLSGEGAVIQAEDLSGRINRSNNSLDLPGALQATTLKEAVDVLESHLISKALEKYHWNKSAVSRKLGLSRLGLQKKIDRLKIIRKESSS